MSPPRPTPLTELASTSNYSLNTASRAIMPSRSRHDREFTDAVGAIRRLAAPSPGSDFENITLGFAQCSVNLSKTKLNEDYKLGPNQKMRPTTKGWTVENLVVKGKRMKPISRISAIHDYDRLDSIIEEYEENGIPLIIEDWHKTSKWPKGGLFSAEWLLKHGEPDISVRNCVNLVDSTIRFADFIEKCRTIPEYVQEGETERLYGKDAICPPEWNQWLVESNIPAVLKPGSSEDVLELLSESERVETLMCYHGIGDTFTAAHKDLCASSGHNLMCNTERGGSAFWFMTQSNDAPNAAAYFHDRLHSDLDHECYAATPEEFANAPFTVYVAEQRLGDLVLVPRRSCHQVVNHGGLTTKLSWSRMTIKGLNIAFHHELPLYKRVCRPETYRVKLHVYRVLRLYCEKMKEVQEKYKKKEDPSLISKSHIRLVNDARTLLMLFEKIIKEEHQGETQCTLRVPHPTKRINSSMCEPESIGLSIPPIKINIGEDLDLVVCDFCRADIFQSYFECRKCAASQKDSGERFIICPQCYVEGRSCACIIMEPVQTYPMEFLFETQRQAHELVQFRAYPKGLMGSGVQLFQQSIHQIIRDHPPIFSSACQVLNMRIKLMMTQRKKDKGNRRCRSYGMRLREDELPDNEGHTCPIEEVIMCKKCHSGKCFYHNLLSGIHAADALPIYNSDPTHAEWHKKHMTGRQKFSEYGKLARKAELAGEACDVHLNLVLNALRYTQCRPYSSTVKSGWYDNKVYFDSEMDYMEAQEKPTGALPDTTFNQKRPEHKSEHESEDESSDGDGNFVPGKHNSRLSANKKKVKNKKSGTKAQSDNKTSKSNSIPTGSKQRYLSVTEKSTSKGASRNVSGSPLSDLEDSSQPIILSETPLAKSVFTHNQSAINEQGIREIPRNKNYDRNKPVAGPLDPSTNKIRGRKKSSQSVSIIDNGLESDDDDLSVARFNTTNRPSGLRSMPKPSAKAKILSAKKNQFQPSDASDSSSKVEAVLQEKGKASRLAPSKKRTRPANTSSDEYEEESKSAKKRARSTVQKISGARIIRDEDDIPLMPSPSRRRSQPTTMVQTSQSLHQRTVDSLPNMGDERQIAMSPAPSTATKDPGLDINMIINGFFSQIQSLQRQLTEHDKEARKREDLLRLAKEELLVDNGKLKTQVDYLQKELASHRDRNFLEVGEHSHSLSASSSISSVREINGLAANRASPKISKKHETSGWNNIENPRRGPPVVDLSNNKPRGAVSATDRQDIHHPNKPRVMLNRQGMSLQEKHNDIQRGTESTMNYQPRAAVSAPQIKRRAQDIETPIHQETQQSDAPVVPKIRRFLKSRLSSNSVPDPLDDFFSAVISDSKGRSPSPDRSKSTPMSISLSESEQIIPDSSPSQCNGLPLPMRPTQTPDKSLLEPIVEIPRTPSKGDGKFWS